MVYMCESWECPTHTSKSCCLYGNNNENSLPCGAGICISTLLSSDRRNLNPLDAAMCIEGIENYDGMCFIMNLCDYIYVGLSGARIIVTVWHCLALISALKQ